MKKLSFLLLFALGLTTAYGQCTLVADAGPDLGFCQGALADTTLLVGGNPAATGGTPPYAYAWAVIHGFIIPIPNANYLSDTTLPNPQLLNSGDTIDLVLTVTDAAGCVARDTARVISSSFSAIGTQPQFIQPGDSVQLFHGIIGTAPPFTFLWSPAETLDDPTAESPWASPEVTTIYTVIITDSLGCTFTDGVEVRVLPVSLGPGAVAADVRVYPNPARGQVRVEVPGGTARVRCYDLRGRLHRTAVWPGTEGTLSLTGLAAGHYVLEVITPQGTSQHRLHVVP